MNSMDSNFILHAQSDQFYWEGKGQLSLKTFINGQAQYRTNKGFFAVEENRFLLLNEGDYTISIESDQPVESFCLFFGSGFAEEVKRSLTSEDVSLLDEPFYQESRQFEIFEKTYRMDPYLHTMLDGIKKNFSHFKNDPLWLEEQLRQVMVKILHSQNHAYSEMSVLEIKKASTREEIYRRLSIAQDYIFANYQRAITLSEISHIACLSPNHLLRNYKVLFGKTPHQQLTERRIEKAKWLLEKTGKSMIEIAMEVGLETPVSFSRLFKQQTGKSPTDYRKMVILDKRKK
ncbi:helix-turn-helix domain-containing protein [Falsibacillus pallidus]|uniref:helix-turn-helix domain-containing protein n=1 Tax=Falsibacillus pallidus TaxID=493781 RepID=UPI003D989C10